MTHALSQIAGDGPAQLPGQTVLRIDCTLPPAVLIHRMDHSHDVMHCRLMINATQASTGRLYLAGGMDDTGQCVWQLCLDRAAGTVALETENEQLPVSLTPAISWQCVEVSLASDTGVIRIRLNGIERAFANTPISASRSVWLGAAFISSGMTGHIDIDQWAISTDSIGVPYPEPTLPHAGDPRRWLVVYNRSDFDSCAWVSAYRDRRHVPDANLCGLDLPMSEAISAAQYETMRQQIGAYLDENGLRGQVVGLLLGLKVPGYADVAGQGALTPIASYLHTDDGHGLPVVNPLYQGVVGSRPSVMDYGVARLTGRIDAPSLAEAIDWMDRADALTHQPMTHDAGGRVLVDINSDSPLVGPVYSQPVAEWANGPGLSRLRLVPVVYDESPPDAISDDAVVWSWRDAAPPSGYFSIPAGRRAICLQLHPDPVPAVAIRDPLADDWISAARRSGYAFCASASRAYSLSSLPLPHLFFEALRAGWTIAESWLIAQPFLRDGLQIIGDPLCSVPFPKAGFDVFGPAQRLDLIDMDQPVAMLHAGEHSYSLRPEDMPAQGVVARYLVRRIDDKGRPDSASAAVFAASVDGQVIRPALPAWPEEEDWPVLQRGGKLFMSGIWAASLRSYGIDRVQLISQAGDQEAYVEERFAPLSTPQRVVFVMDRPSVTTRYRLAVFQGDATFFTPWSQPVITALEPVLRLTILEHTR